MSSYQPNAKSAIDKLMPEGLATTAEFTAFPALSCLPIDTLSALAFWREVKNRFLRRIRLGKSLDLTGMRHILSVCKLGGPKSIELSAQMCGLADGKSIRNARIRRMSGSEELRNG